MRFSCLINSFNYDRYIAEAVASALDQTSEFDEIIVVDDGSTDSTLELLHEQFGDAITLVKQANAGQLACFNRAHEVATGDVLCFLDADDRFNNIYVKSLREVYNDRQDVDFVYSGHRVIDEFGTPSETVCAENDIDHGITLLQTYYDWTWCGAPTSCLSLRREALDRILPLPFESQWKTRADDCLVFGASMVGARKLALSAALVDYRIHGDNHFANRHCQHDFTRSIAISQLLEHLCARNNLVPSRLANYAYEEFASTGQSLTLARMLKYTRLAKRAGVPWQRRCSLLKKMWRTRRQSKRPRTELAAEVTKTSIANESSTRAESPFLSVLSPKRSA